MHLFVKNNISEFLDAVDRGDYPYAEAIMDYLYHRLGLRAIAKQLAPQLDLLVARALWSEFISEGDLTHEIFGDVSKSELDQELNGKLSIRGRGSYILA